MMPDGRMAPPICCFRRHASAMNSREPARAAPTGAPSPLVKSIQAESKGAAHSRAATPLATTAFRRRAPSVRGQTVAAGDIRHRADALERPDRPAAQVARLLHPHEPAARVVTEVGPNARLQRRGVDL